MGDWFDSDSDFDMSDSEADSSDDGYTDYPCNTMLITGPHGVGKTALVYALAQEIGYKVRYFTRIMFIVFPLPVSPASQMPSFPCP